MPKFVYILLIALFGSMAMAIPPQEPTARKILVDVDGESVLRETEKEFLSVALDTAQVVGGYWWPDDGSEKTAPLAKPFDFRNAKFQNRARHLKDVIFRVGGTEADHVFYDLSDNPMEKPPKDFATIMTRHQWDELQAFVKRMDWKLMFTVNAGPGHRQSKDKVWEGANFEELIRYAHSKGHQVDVWEFGNEVNAFSVLFGRKWKLSGKDYARDYKAFQNIVNKFYPKSRKAGPALAVWPRVGEVIPMHSRMMKKYLQKGGLEVDVFTWHFYPTQSQRCPVAVRRTSVDNVIAEKTLKELDKQAEVINKRIAKYAPQAEVWLGESGSAQCGGQKGISDTFISGLWWIDHLARSAANGQKVLVRQTLASSDYGLMHGKTFEENPDYWNSILWKHFMGPKVLKTLAREKKQEAKDAYAYAHCAVGGGVSFVLLNVDRKEKATFSLPNLGRSETYVVSSDRALSRDVQMNGKVLKFVGAKDDLPAFIPYTRKAGQTDMTLDKHSYAFVVFPEADVAACR